MATELTIPNSQLTTARQRHNTLRSNLERFESSLTTLRENLVYVEAANDFAQEQGNMFIEMAEQILDSNDHIWLFRDAIHRLQNSFDVASLKRNIDRNESSRKNTIAELAEVNEQLAALSHLPPEHVIHIDDVIAQLGDHPNILTESIKLNGDFERIEWTMSGITMRPDRNPYKYINGGKIPSIPLQDIRINIYPQNATVYVFTADSETGHYLWNGYTNPHPHILSDNEPCLGHYNGPIVEAIHEGDWSTVAGLLVLFFSGAANYDEAGRGWVRGVRHEKFLNHFDFDFEEARDEDGETIEDEYENISFETFRFYDNEIGYRHVEFWQNPRNPSEWLMFDEGEGEDEIQTIRDEMEVGAHEAAQEDAA